MEPGWTESILHREPARRKDDEIQIIHAWGRAEGLQHEKDRRIRVVIADRAQGVETSQVVFVRRVIAVPRDDIERRMIDRRRPQLAAELCHQLTAGLTILVARDRGEEIARIGETVRTDRPEIRQAQRRPEILADVTSSSRVDELDAKSHAARQHRDFLRLDLKSAELRGQAQSPQLGHEQKLAIRVVEKAIAHGSVGAIPVDGTAGVQLRSSVAPDTGKPGYEVRGLRRDRQRIPAERIRRDFDVIEAAGRRTVGQAFEFTMHSGRTDAVQPGAAIAMARRGECGSGELLGVQSIGAALRGVASLRQCTGQRLGREMIAEAGLILQHDSPAWRAMRRN